MLHEVIVEGAWYIIDAEPVIPIDCAVKLMEVRIAIGIATCERATSKQTFSITWTTECCLLGIL